MSKSSLATENYPAHDSNFTYGRSGKNIEAITIHHMAGKLTAKQCGEIFQIVGRNGSSHYGIGYNGEIASYVDEANTAWTNSNWDSNCKSVTIETSNSVNGGNWEVNDITLNSLIKLVADIAKRNNLGTLVKGKNLTWHSMFANTSCPGPYLLSKIDYIIEEANKINHIAEINIEQIDKKSIILNKDTSLWNLDFTKIDNAKSVKSFSKGTQIDNIVAIATHECGSKYYMTEYSYINSINNGFNVVDCDEITEEPPTSENEPVLESKEEDSINTPIDTETSNDTLKETNYYDDKEQNNVLLKLIEYIINILKKLFKSS